MMNRRQVVANALALGAGSVLAKTSTSEAATAAPSGKLPPAYDNLPLNAGESVRTAWGVWGKDDTLGALNLLTEERIRAAAKTVRRGATFPLNWKLDLPNPPVFGRAKLRHTILDLGGGGYDDIYDNWNPQSGSQYDGFIHVGGPKGFYNGQPMEKHGMHTWAKKGIAGRAVLMDAGRWRASVGRPLAGDKTDPIDLKDVKAMLAAQKVSLKPSDIVLLRTGWTGWYETLTQEQRVAVSLETAHAGFLASSELVKFFWDSHVSIIGTDLPAVEAWPAPTVRGPNHPLKKGLPGEDINAFHFVVSNLGIPLGEMWALEALAEDCAKDGVYEGLFTSAPLNMEKGVSSPPNAMVIK